MSSKKQRKSIPEIEKDEKIQAVVLADSFMKRFQPLTRENPKALLPVVNTPMVSYAIEWLVSNGIDRIFVFASSFSEKIEEFVRNLNIQGVSIVPITGSDCHSVGDALREIDAMQIIESDFVLVSGDIFSNMSLSVPLEQHRKRRSTDKLAIMTRVLRRVALTHPNRCVDDKAVIALSKGEGRICEYVDLTANQRAQLSLEVINENPNGVTVHTDLVPAGVDICSPEVILQFAENFDYQDMCNDFIHGILQSEILGYKLHAYVMPCQEYCARINCFRSYAAVVSDVIRRWVYPIVPENNLFGDTSYVISRGHLYRESNVKLSRSCRIGYDTVLGGSTVLGDKSSVANTSVGRNCVIGQGAKVKASILWEDVHVGDGSVIENSLLCTGVKIGKNCVIKGGCVLSYGVVLGDNVTLEPGTRLTTLPAGAEDDDSDFGDLADDTSTAELISDPAIVGANGIGRVWVCCEGDNPKLNSLAPEAGLWDDVEDVESDAEDEEGEGPTVMGAFAREAQEMMKRALSEKVDLDHIQLELNALKFAYNRTFAQVVEASLPVLLDTVQPDEQPARVVKALKDLLKTWAPLFIRLIGSREDDQIDLIVSLEDYCLEPEHDHIARAFHHVLHVLYDLDVLSESSILKWAEEEEQSGTDPRFLTMCSKLLEWLRDAEEESDDGSDEGGSSSEESE
eukprot:Rmarinus@m.4481